MSLRFLPVALVAFGLLVPVARADDSVSPADRTIVLDAGKSASVKVETDPCSGLNITAVITGGGGNVTVSPAVVNGKTKAQFKVAVAKNAGATQATLTITINCDADGGTTYTYDIFAVMKEKNAEAGLKMQTKAAQKQFKTNAKAAVKAAKASYASQLAATETALDNLLALPADSSDQLLMSTLAMQRADLMRQAVLQGLIIHMILNANLLGDHVGLGLNPIFVVFFNYLVAYSNPLVAPNAFMMGGKTVWLAFLLSMHGIATQSSLAGVGLLQAYFGSLAKLGLASGLPLPFLFLAHGYGMSPRYLQGASAQDKSSLFADGSFPDGIPLQISALVAMNNPLPGPNSDAGVNHGFLGVAGMAGPENGDVTITVTQISGGVFLGGPELTKTVTQATLLSAGGTFAVVFDGSEGMLPGPDGEPDFGSMSPGQYRVTLSQEEEESFLGTDSGNVRRYIDLPRSLAQSQ